MSFIGLFDGVKKYLHVNTDKETIDNLIFRCHYRLTTIFFWISSILLTAYSFIGKPILCIHNSGFDKDFFNQYCWTTATYSLTNKNKNHIYQLEDAIAGHAIIHDYYQWVPFVLFFHGLCFYLPHWIWKTVEGGKIKLLSDDIRRTAIADTEDKRKKRALVVEYLVRTQHHHKKYAFAYFGCELLNLIVSIATMFIIDVFLGNEFLHQGLNLITRTQENPYKRIIDTEDKLIDFFPRMTICDLKTYGLAGITQSANALCVLPLNALNEKIYIFAWFWLVFLSAITFCAVAYSVAFLTLPDIRRMVIINRFKFDDRDNQVSALIRAIGIGDFLLLHFLGQNLSTMTFQELLKDLNKKVLTGKEVNQLHWKATEADGTDKSTSTPDNQYPLFHDETAKTVDLDKVEAEQSLISYTEMFDQQSKANSVSAP